MDFIKRGITGFADPGRRLTPLHANSFLAFVHSTAPGRIVLTWEDIDLTGKNYYWFLVTFGEEEWSFFLNAYYPLAAIRRESPKSRFGYFTEAELDVHYPDRTQIDYTLLSREMLEELLTPEAMSRLDAAELKQARYWQPRSVEDLVFNNWD
ncbi:hypothetical protein [Paenibacillus sp. 1P07SE]|uniref:hypothetical protein n=1 Tax=Paenibacillus sp. 1P07SE TaxID=3132209 RepID=UPI0039A49E71